MKRVQRKSIFISFWLMIGLVGLAAQDNREKPRSAGLGYGLTSTGQSISYNRSWDFFNRNHPYGKIVFHTEEEGISVSYYNPYTGYYEDRVPQQKYYIELAGGWRHFWLMDKIEGSLLPHTIIQAGVSSHITKFGRLKNWLTDTQFAFAPQLQIGAGVTIYAEMAIYRFELGWLETLNYTTSDRFALYNGFYLNISAATSQRAKSR